MMFSQNQTKYQVKWRCKTLSSFWEIMMPGRIVALVTRREEQKEMEAGKFKVYVVVDMAVNSRTFSVEKRVEFLEASWPQTEDESYSCGGITRLSYMRYSSSGKCSLTGLVTTLPTLLSTAGGQWKKYVSTVGLFFSVCPQCPIEGMGGCLTFCMWPCLKCSNTASQCP